MPIDRAATLRNAEKLLRQGKLEPAIAEYLRVVEDDSRDWNSANTLGDLYVRAGKMDKAVEQFIRIADSLNDEGFLPKAGALYKKILKLKPDHEHALMQGAEISVSQGLLADARAYLNTVMQRRQARGDKRGVAQVKIRLGSLDPADYAARMAAASARIEIGDTPGAVRDLKEMAAELTEKGRQADAIEVLRDAAKLDPAADEIRQQLLGVYVSSGDFERARACASTPEQFKSLAAAIEAAGNQDEALKALAEAARLDPSDTELYAQLARAYVARGDLTSAAQYLTVETAGDDPQLLLTVAEIQLRGGKQEDGLALVKRLLERDPERGEHIAVLGWTLAEQTPDVGFSVVELAADAAVARTDWGSAAAVLQEFVTRVPNHIPALMRLVEICVDGGLEATMYSAQAQLADAYIAAGSATEARFIAEDLVAREPWDRANIERFRRALELLGEPDPDALIAERLSGHSPFTSTDLSLGPEDLAPPQPASQQPEVGALPVEPEVTLQAASGETPKPKEKAPAAKRGRGGPKAADEGRDYFELSANAIDLQSILGELESPRATARATSESVEVDLSVVLNDIKRPQTPGAPAPPAAASAPGAPSGDIDGVFEHLRDEAGRRSALDAAEEQYRRGLALREAGDVDGCIQALQSASRAPKLRFATASLLGRIYRDRGMMPQAVEWFERAAQAPAPTADESYALLYELADALEKEGETARALAVSLELQAEAGDYRDIAGRVDRLTKVQARG